MTLLKDKFAFHSDVDFLRSIRESITLKTQERIDNKVSEIIDLRSEYTELSFSEHYSTFKEDKKKLRNKLEKTKSDAAKIADARVRLLIRLALVKETCVPLELSLLFELPDLSKIAGEMFLNLLERYTHETFEYLYKNLNSITPDFLIGLWDLSTEKSASRIFKLSQDLAKNTSKTLEERLSFIYIVNMLVSFYSDADKKIAVELQSEILSQLKVKRSLEDVPESWVLEICREIEVDTKQAYII